MTALRAAHNFQLTDREACCNASMRRALRDRRLEICLPLLLFLRHLELPHVNVLSKIDLLASYGELGMHSLL